MWIVMALVIVGGLLAMNAGKKEVAPDPAALNRPPAAVPVAKAVMPLEPTPAGKPIPRLVDLGATKCNACKMLAPILEEMRTNYAGRLDVQFIDVWENPEAGKEYGIKIIPTQIFYDAEGKERFRHEGFFSKEEILAKWKELGVEFGTPSPAK
jgi:thioredoxin 1